MARFGRRGVTVIRVARAGGALGIAYSNSQRLTESNIREYVHAL